mgnify:CR=1 FL=1
MSLGRLIRNRMAKPNLINIPETAASILKELLNTNLEITYKMGYNFL